MSSMWVRILVSTLLLAAFASPLHAQIEAPSFLDPLTLTLSPEFPESNSVVHATVESRTLNILASDITWYVNGTRVGDGERDIDIPLGGLGSETTITVIVNDGEHPPAQITRTLRSNEVDIVWEATSYVPPLYQGKRLPSPATSVRAESFARLARGNGSLISSKDIVYTWRRNGALVAGASGRGKSRATFPAPLLFGEDTLSVEAASLDGTLIAEKSVRVPSADPFVLLYHDHPLFGVLYNSALGSSTVLPDVEATLAAIPYFSASTNPNSSSFTYEWKVNGTAVPTDPRDPHRLTLNAASSDGTARVELNLTHATDWFMSAKGLWNLVLSSGFGGAISDPFQNNTLR